MTGFLAGFTVGAVVAWYVSRAVERFRRARRDFRVARSGLRTLVEMMFRRGWDAAKWAAIGAGIVVVVVVAVAWHSGGQR